MPLQPAKPNSLSSNIRILKPVLRLSKITIVIILFLLAQRATAQVKAAFSSDVSNGCSPLLVNFKNLSTGVDSATNYYWDLGNGSTPSQQQNPSALFLNPG